MRMRGFSLAMAVLGLAVLLGGCGGGGGGGTYIPRTNQPVTPPPSGTPTLTLTAPDDIAAETDGTPDPARIVITRTGATTAALLVNVVADGTISNQAGEDFTEAPIGSQVEIPAGSDRVELAINPVNDAEIEGLEILLFRLLPEVGVYRLDAVTEVTIEVFDDDAIVLDLDVTAAKNRIDAEASNPNFQIVDVRTPAEFAGGHLEGAINIDVQAADFSSRISALDRAGSYLVYCAGGTRSAMARDQMAQKNHREILNMLGGINAWTSAGYPVVTD